MFNREKKLETASNNNIDPTALNSIKAGTVITGEIVSDGLIRLDGKLKGNLTTAGKLIIGATGEVLGDIKCKQADIEGMVEGKIIVSDLLSFKSTARFKGEVITKRLAIEPGATFNGTCNMATNVIPVETPTYSQPLKNESKKI
jgi:cytoskeletal protein CcmA (bactofilin family)